MEKTFVMLKPDALQRNLIGEIISRLEKRGLKIVAMKMIKMDKEMAEEHYKEHKGKSFYDELVNFIISGPVIAMVWEGMNAVQVMRTLMGSTAPQEASPGTIRGDYALFTGNNLIHGADSKESAEEEISLFFNQEEIVSYSKDLDVWLYG